MPTRFAIYPSPIGYIRIEHRDQRLTSLQILDTAAPECGARDSYLDTIFEQILDTAAPVCGARDSYLDTIFEQILEYLRGERQQFDVELDISSCTPFQQRTLSELRKIPYGATMSYGEIAKRVGNPKAARAIGSACNRNPIQIIIPCHRVISTRGNLTGYAAGLERKSQLLKTEKGSE